MKTLKNGQKCAIKFDRKGKIAKHRCHQQIYYKLRNKEGYLQGRRQLSKIGGAKF